MVGTGSLKLVQFFACADGGFYSLLMMEIIPFTYLVFINSRQIPLPILFGAADHLAGLPGLRLKRNRNGVLYSIRVRDSFSKAREEIEERRREKTDDLFPSKKKKLYYTTSRIKHNLHA